MMAVSCVFVVVVGLAVYTGCVAGLRCMECDGDDPTVCDKTTECEHGDSCFVREFITPGGLVQFKTGCMSATRCPSSRRSLPDSGDLLTCLQCCNTDFCNTEGCGKTAKKQPARGPLCFKCDYQNGPDKCRDVAVCDVSQKCILQRSHFHRQLLTSGCASDAQCETLTTNITQDHVCITCCKGDFCNDYCNYGAFRTSAIPTHTTTVGTMKQSPTTRFTTASGTKATAPLQSMKISTTAPPSTTQQKVHKTQRSTQLTTVAPNPTIHGKFTTVQPTTQGHVTTAKLTTHGHLTTFKHSTHGKVTSAKPILHLQSTTGPHSSTTDTHDPLCKGKEMDVCFILDVSGSQSRDEFRHMLEFTAKVVGDLDVGVHGKQRICAIVLEAQSAMNAFDLNHKTPKVDIIKRVLNITYSKDATESLSAIIHSMHLLNGREKHVVVLTDGQSSRTNLTKKFFRTLHHASPIDVTTIGIGDGVDRHELLTITSDVGTVMTTPDFNSLDSLKHDVVSRLCHVHLKPATKPSHHDHSNNHNHHSH